MRRGDAADGGRRLWPLRSPRGTRLRAGVDARAGAPQAAKGAAGGVVGRLAGKLDELVRSRPARPGPPLFATGSSLFSLWD